MTTDINMKKLKTLQTIYAILIGLVVLVLFLVNYKHGTYLMGWDNLMPEFDLSINWERHLTASWQEYQGVGLEGGISWAADLPRVIIVALLNLILPTNMVRYSYMFLSLYAGALGVFYLSSWLLTLYRQLKLDINSILLLSFTTAMFYLLNHGTIETFYAPIETFPTQWAFLPWILYLFLRFCREGGKGNLIGFMVVTILGIPMAQVPTTYLMTVLVLIVAGSAILIDGTIKKELTLKLKRILILALTTLFLNAFWLLPFLSFYRSGGADTVQNASINQIFSEDIYYRNAARGTFADVTILRGFLYDTFDRDTKQEQFTPMMEPWIVHFKQGFIVIGYIHFALMVAGLTFAAYRRLDYWPIFGLLFLISIFLLSASNGPSGVLFEEVRERSSLFREVFRFPYTKTAQVANLTYTLLFLFGLTWLNTTLRAVTGNFSKYFLTTIMLFSIFIYGYPAFKGDLFYKEVRVKIPDAYFEMFEYFKDKPSQARIANWPQSEFMNWYFYDWGYRGSGFYWYGLKQPVMDRSFDSWSWYNEQYFREMRDAIYSEELTRIEGVMKKYQIGWIVYDESQLTGDRKAQDQLYQERLIPMLNSSENFELEEIFGDGLAVIAYKPVIEESSFVKGYAGEPTSANPVSGKLFEDLVGNTLSLYSSNLDGNNDREYLMRDLRSIEEGMEVSTQLGQLSFEEKMPGSITKVHLPGYWEYERYGLLKINPAAFSPTGYTMEWVTPQINIDGEDLSYNQNRSQFIAPTTRSLLFTGVGAVELRRDASQYLVSGAVERASFLSAAVRIDLSEQLLDAKVVNCDDNPQRGAVVDSKNEYGLLVINARKAQGCADIAVTRQLNSIPTELLVAKLSFEYKSKTNNYPAVCVSQGNGCIAEINPTSLSSGISKFQYYENYFRLDPNKSVTVRVSLYDTQFVEGLQELQVRSMQVTGYVYNTDLALPQLKSFDGVIAAREGEHTVRVSYPIVEESALSDRIELNQLAELPARNCIGEPIVGPKGEYNYTVDPSTRFVTMQSVNSSLCVESWNRDRLPLSESYIVGMESKNVQNYPLEVRVVNKQYDITVDNYLLKKNGWNLKVVDGVGGGQSEGMRIDLSNLSRGGIKAENVWKDGFITFFPTKFVQEIYGEGESGIEEEVRVVEVESRRVGPYLYTVEQISKGEMVVLKQGYSEGWKMVGGQARKLMVDSWSNGWVMDEGSEGKVYLIFMPQLYQFVGFGMLLIALIFGVLVRDQKKQKG